MGCGRSKITSIYPTLNNVTNAQQGTRNDGKISKTTSLSGKKITIIHFNDVYNIEPRNEEPVGGAARFVSLVKSFGHLNPLILFSGDAFNPSIISTITKGQQMVPVLNAIGVHVAAVGNHDLDFGVSALEKLSRQCNFPWLMANVIDKNTNKTLARAKRKWVFDWNGVRVGVMGLVEREWLTTLATLDNSQVQYIDYVEEGRRLVQELRAQGAELIIALTHMRMPNDRRLATEVAGIDLVLGGHDHHYEVQHVPPFDTYIFKSGTDFRELSVIDITFADPTKIPADYDNHTDLYQQYKQRQQEFMKVVSYKRYEVTGKIKEDEEVRQVVQQYTDMMDKEMETYIGFTAVALDGRFEIIRRQESNLCNFICDVWLLATNADVALLNAGTVRSDTVHRQGELRLKDLVSILPMMDETCLLQVDGYTLLAALENGVSQYPKFDGRFPQVGGMRFQFDPSQPPGTRVDPDSVYVREKKLNLNRVYQLATKEYLRQGKDGYECFKESAVLVNSEESPTLPTIIRNYFDNLERLSKVQQEGRGQSMDSELVSIQKQIDRQQYWDASKIGTWNEGSQRYEILPLIEGRVTTTVANRS